MTRQPGRPRPVVLNPSRLEAYLRKYQLVVCPFWDYRTTCKDGALNPGESYLQCGGESCLHLPQQRLSWPPRVLGTAPPGNRPGLLRGFSLGLAALHCTGPALTNPDIGCTWNSPHTAGAAQPSQRGQHRATAPPSASQGEAQGTGREGGRKPPQGAGTAVSSPPGSPESENSPFPFAFTGTTKASPFLSGVAGWRSPGRTVHCNTGHLRFPSCPSRTV